MKVLYLSKALVVEAYRDKLAALRRATGGEVCALVPERWGATRVESPPARGPIHFRPALLHGHNHLHLYRGLAEVVESESPDLVHIDEEPYSLVTLQAARLCNRLGIPSVFFAWQNLPKRLPPPFGAVRRAVFQQVAGGIAGTTAAAGVLRAAGFSGPLAVAPQFGVDPRRFAPDPEARQRTRDRLGAGPDEVVVGFAGRLVREKGVDLLLRAAADLPTVRLALLGDGPARASLSTLADELDVQWRTLFLGHAHSGEVPAWLNGLDILVLPSRRTRSWAEQFGRVLVEAMACGVPVVGTRSGEIPDVVGDAGLLVDEDDVSGLRQTLERLAEDADLRAALARRGRERVLAHFTQDRVAAETAAFYSQVLTPSVA